MGKAYINVIIFLTKWAIEVYYPSKTYEIERRDYICQITQLI
jgi:hypothetical protein